MRYVVAMVFAIVVAGLTTVFLSLHVADWVVAHESFESSDDAENLHMLTFIATNVVALLVGWLIGWTIAGGRQPT
jgi:hypothetical protein